MNRRFEPSSDAGNESGSSLETTRITSNQPDEQSSGLQAPIPETTRPAITAPPDDTDPPSAVETFIETQSQLSGAHIESQAGPQ